VINVIYKEKDCSESSQRELINLNVLAILVGVRKAALAIDYIQVC